MKLAIVGSGISGLTAAYHLYREHDITVFEADDRVGGHTHTHTLLSGGEPVSVDTGFIVFNNKTYPRFTALLDELGVGSQPSDMSFSVSCERTGIEYNGTSLDTLFAQRRNLFRPAFLRMIREILRFNEELTAWLGEHPHDDGTTLGDYLRENGYSAMFCDYYIIPMGAAIWSAGRETMASFPLRFFGRFFHNHGMLSVDDRPVWRVVRGGSSTYVAAMTRHFGDRIRTQTPVVGITREPHAVVLETAGGARHRFDEVILAVHSDQARAMLRDPSDDEHTALSALPYERNEVVLHTDTRLLPKRKKAWAAWNYHLFDRDQGRVAVTYDMNRLQSLEIPDTFCVTLNATDRIDPERIIATMSYDHPIFSLEGTRAQARIAEINGTNRTHFCGAWCFNGFHEDGVRSALRVVEGLNAGSTNRVIGVGA